MDVDPQKQSMDDKDQNKSSGAHAEPVCKPEENASDVDDERKIIDDYIAEAKERIQAKENSRKINLNAPDNRPDESFFGKLDSNLKKNTAFIRKLKTLTEAQKDSLCQEMMGLNLTKYIGEVAGALIDAKLKMSDVHCVVSICGLIHQRYADFSSALIDAFNKVLLGKKDEKVSNASKYRVDLRLLGELISHGVFTAKEGLPILANQLSMLVNSDKEEHNYLPIITSFCKFCGEDYTGIVPRKYRLMSEKFGLDVPQSQMLRADRQRGCRNLLKDYYASLLKHVINSQRELKSQERQNRKIMQTKGEVSTERRETYELTFTNFQKLFTNAALLADLLDEDIPQFQQEAEASEDGTGGLDIFNPLKDAEFQYEGDKTLFEDEDTRSFYETLPDLRAVIPGILYKDSENVNGKNESKKGNTGLEEEMEQLAVDDIEKELETEQIEEAMKQSEQQEEGAEEPEQEDRMVLLEIEEDDTETGTLLRVQFESFLTSLPNSVNRDLIDKAAVEFCMNFNTKVNRKKLVKSLFSVHRTRYDLLPFYSRFVAILEPCMPELASDLVQMLKADFKWHIRKKDQINIESKVKTVRYVGELVKFKVCPKIEALHCLKMLMFDFRHHNVEMACALLETCGRFLYRSPDSHYRTKVYLEVMMRKKSAMKLESRYETMIENAFYYSNPPEVTLTPHKERPPMHEYIRKLLYKDLSKVTVEKVLRQMRKLKWADSEIAFYATKCLTAVWNIRYNSVHCAANLLAGIAPFHEHVAIQVVDGVLEEIRLGMEVNDPKYNQRRVSCVKYLGELYNYRMVESSVIFRVLYSLITFGISMDAKVVSPLDPPDHLFRIRLVCVLLEACGQYFDKGSSKKKLDCFLVYFQRYYWWKRSLCEGQFPIDVENLMQETLEMVRPRLVPSASYDEAVQAAQLLETEYKDRLATVLSVVDSEGGTELVESEEEDDQDDDEEEEDEDEDIDEEDDELSSTLEGDELSVTEGSGTQESEASLSGQDGEGDESSLEDYEGTDNEDQETEVKVTKSKPVKSKEDEDFMTALDTMINETLKTRTQEGIKVPQLDIALPTGLKNKRKIAPPPPLQVQPGGLLKKSPEEDDESLGWKFVLMTRRGNKQQLTDFEIPMTAEFATKFKEREEAERLEKEKMKQMVLNFHERQEEEEYQESLASMNRSPPTNVNRERKVKYQHPKGAPDADLIFGNKKR